MHSCIAHQLRWRIEAHRLAVEQGSQKRRRCVTLQPTRHIHQQGKASGMRLRKTVIAKATNLPEQLLRELCRVAPQAHAFE